MWGGCNRKKETRLRWIRSERECEYERYKEKRRVFNDDRMKNRTIDRQDWKWQNQHKIIWD